MPGRARDMLSLQQVAERAGFSRTETLAYLQELHEQHGGLLFRRPGQRTKYWVDAVALARLWPSRFGSARPRDISELHAAVEHAERVAKLALRKLAMLRRT